MNQVVKEVGMNSD